MFILDHSSLLLAAPRNVFTAIGLPLVVGMYSGSYTPKAANGKWYNSLRFPPFRAYNSVFPFAWGGLYIAMGYASHLAVRAYDSAFLPEDLNATSTGIALYYGQLALNVIWSPLFFVKKTPSFALVDATLLTATTMWMTKVLHKPTGGATTYFLLPYCAWLSYALYLNAGVVFLNKDRNVPKDD
ncbi:hypothetical protein PHLGIDRAFT_100874 [Phlebiopsis gigantea 11061_1 CR5-6]|uniref:TspO/MBR-related protein n=1 Tax=Phlebiopsis gigantea (strain 11061_1 CR5-6) TaxID=745531 RepID=A0A0C3SC98_PHLG1|nr:hypothetical protein PHLGIDRAFT_100874 [Phlebiopsis gigantea 11061_1 CR5-6]